LSAIPPLIARPDLEAKLPFYICHPTQVFFLERFEQDKHPGCVYTVFTITSSGATPLCFDFDMVL